jgi:hypothetical protein
MSMDLFAKYSSLRFIVLQNSGGVRCYLPRTSIYLPGHIFFPYNFYGLKRPENGHPLTKGHILMCVGCDWYSGENGAHTRIDKRAHLGVRSLSSRTVQWSQTFLTYRSASSYRVHATRSVLWYHSGRVMNKCFTPLVHRETGVSNLLGSAITN